MSVGCSSWQFRHSPTLLCSFHHLCLLHGSSTSTIRMLHEPLRSSRSDSHTLRRPRRSADYQPTRWNYDFLESLSTQDFKGEYEEQRAKMIAGVKEMLQCSSIDSLRRLELVDAIDRLGLKRHFQEETRACVESIYHDDVNKYDLRGVALMFRVLRQHGYVVSEDVFNKYKDQQGNIREEFMKDIRGLLSLYEASFLESRGDDTLEEIRASTSRHLEVQLNTLKPKWAKVVQQALDLPLHWRFPRLKARLSIDEAHDHHVLHPSLVSLAKLDYNIVQTCYKDEIKQLVRWWKELELPRKLPYTRDRLMEHYLWTVGLAEEPEFCHYRVMETKVVTLITALDDTYDVYGTFEELEIFTDLMNRWEINGIDQLPEPMRHCFLAIHNTSNKIADWALKERGFHIISYLSKAWARLCNKYLQEARWYRDGYKPTLNEYLDNGIVTIGAHLMLLDCYFLTTSSISMEAIDYINNLPNLLCCGHIRLSNDLATSADELARGDTYKALECYMNESGASEKVAREHINCLIQENWKKMNQEYYLLCHAQYPPTIAEPFLGASLNLARSSQFFYSYKKDWHGKPDREMMDHMSSLFLNPIPMCS